MCANFIFAIILMTWGVNGGSGAGLPLIEKSTALVDAECQVLTQQCAEEALPHRTGSVGAGDADAVCGSDGRTYASRCQVQRARCEGHPVRVRHRGNCYGEEKRCWAERRLAQQTATRIRSGTVSPKSGTVTSGSGLTGSETFIPECSEDGTFSQIQCHRGTGYCWCVHPDGKPISGTSIRNKRPNCKGQVKSSPSRRSPQGRKLKNGCPPTERANFHNNLLQLFTEEYNKNPANPSQKSELIADWKFSQLDLNRDGELSTDEWKRLLRSVRKSNRSNNCVKNLARICDTDLNRRVSRSEWEDCVSPNTEETDDLILAQKSVTLQESRFMEESDAVESNDCITDKQSALEEIKHGAQGMYVPECTPDNKYNRIQCHQTTGYCWCANQVTGKPVPGTSTKNGSPNCDISITSKGNDKPRIKHLTAEQACPGTRKSKLQNGLRSFLQENMATQLGNKQNGSRNSEGVHVNYARWHFQQLDKNSNKLIDRQELKELRQLLRRSPALKRCAKRVPAFCDTNSDNKISLEEWLECLGISKGQSATPAPATSGKRRGPNPLNRYLKDT